MGQYQSTELNALAISSVFGKDSAVAFSTTLINTASITEFMAIAAHEVAHIKNADSKNKSYILAFHQAVNFYPALIAHISKEILVKISGVVLFVAALIFLITVKTFDTAGILAAIKPLLPILSLLFPFFAAIFGAYLLNRITDLFYFHYSRQREFAADADGAAMTSSTDMKQALQLLSTGVASKMSFFDTHPPTADRLSRL